VSDHPFVARLRELPANFPELAGDDMLARTARMVILPQMIRAASKQPDAFRATAVRFVARFVVALDVRPNEIFLETDAPAEAAKAPTIADPADRTAPSVAPDIGSEPAAADPPEHEPPPATSEKLDRILAGE